MKPSSKNLEDEKLNCKKCGKEISRNEYCVNWGWCAECFDNDVREYYKNLKAKEKIKMKMHDFRIKHSRLWAIGMLVPMLLITLLIVPIGYLVEVARDIPRVVSNLWGDLCSMFSEPFRQNWRVLKAWRLWFDTLCGRDSL